MRDMGMMSPVQFGGTGLGWWKHLECNRSFFFAPAEGLLLHPDADDVDKWCHWCRRQSDAWEKMPGHRVLEPEEHWRLAVDNAAKALYQASPVSIHAPLWETLSPSRKQGYRAVAEQVLKGCSNDIRAAAISEVLRLLHGHQKDALRYVYDNIPLTAE
jgi:hypothetical protein